MLSTGGIDVELNQMKKRVCVEPFDWANWVCQLPNSAPSLNRPRSRFRNHDAPLNTALSHSQLVRTARTTEKFLGAAASFDPQVDEGWGEKHGNPRRFASVGCHFIFILLY